MRLSAFEEVNILLPYLPRVLILADVIEGKFVRFLDRVPSVGII